MLPVAEMLPLAAAGWAFLVWLYCAPAAPHLQKNSVVRFARNADDR